MTRWGTWCRPISNKAVSREYIPHTPFSTRFACIQVSQRPHCNLRCRTISSSRATTGFSFPLPRSKTGSRLGGKKAQSRMDTEFLDWALADFSGYVAADELYDGPFCVLSAVDNRRYKRLLYDVLDHDPTHDDIRAFLGRLKTALVARGLTLCGVTTDGSALYPEPLKEVFGKVRHQICQFHVIKDIIKAVVGAVASARKGLAAMQPKL